MACPNCQTEVQIPKLGELRKLPLAETAETRKSPERTEGSGLAVAGFLIFSLIAAASLLVAGFCGIRWGLIEVPATTDQHIAIIRDDYSKLSAAELIREYEFMEEPGLDLGVPFDYKVTQGIKAKWGQNASIAAGVGGISLLGAIGFGFLGRRKTD